MFRPIIVAIFAEVFYAIYSKIILNICIYNCLFYFLQWINRAWSRIIWSGYQVLSQGLKRPELEAHHQPVSSHKVKDDNRYLYPHRYAYLSCKFHWIFAFIFKTPRLHGDAVGWSTALHLTQQHSTTSHKTCIINNTIVRTYNIVILKKLGCTWMH